jgi:hypothetical protein
MLKLSDAQQEVLNYLIDIYPQKVPLFYIEDNFINRSANIRTEIEELIKENYINPSNERVIVISASEKSVGLFKKDSK